MSEYNTGNPVPSIDPRDLDDNATILDNLVNGGSLTYNDRLDRPRKSFAGMEADVAALVGSGNLSALASLTGAANRLPYFTGAGAMSLTTLTAVARSLLDDADAAAMLTTLGIPWAGATTAINATDLNTVTNTCVLGISSGTLNVPVGAASGSMALTLVYSSSNMQQIVTSRTGDQVFFRRNSASTWQPWVSFVMSGANSTITSLTGLTTPLSVAQGGSGGTSQPFTRANAVGTVSQTTGVPTGAIIESNSNVNGTYTKWADGRLECVRISNHTSVAITTGIGSSFYSSTGLAALPFAATFIAAPYVSTDIIAVGAPITWAQNSIPTTTTGPGVFLMYPISNTVNVTRYELAIGRWF